MADSHKIKLLSGVEAIQLRPGMYIGDTSNPNHLAQEVLDNAIDELMEGYADTITLTIDNEDHSVTVTDNGRGIPIHNVKLKHGKTIDSIEAACTELHSGSKFTESSYQFSSGMHGIGLVAVNALSLEMSIGVVKNDKLHTYQFEKGALVSKNIVDVPDDIDWTTLVYFKVNPEYFTSTTFATRKFNERLYLIKAKFPRCTIILNNKEIPSITLRQYASYILGYQTELPKNKLPHLHIENTTYKVDVYFTYNPNGSSVVRGDVNGIICGGAYQTNFETAFYNSVCDVFKDKPPRNVILSGLQAYVSLMLSHTQFSSQTKTYMTKNVSNILNKLKSEISKIVKNNPFFRDTIKEVIEEYNRRKAARNLKVAKKVVSVENPLKDSLKIPGKILYIVEGESAGGTLQEIRDIHTEAIFPLSGKILNVGNATIETVLNSKKFKYLLEALGVDLKQKEQTSFRYDQVGILTDADSDGAHIGVLVLLALWKFAPYLIKTGNVYVITPPLYGVYKNNKFIPIFTNKELKNYNGKITRFKGLGEMNSDQLEVIIRDPKYRYVVKPPMTEKEEKSIFECITNVELKRTLCNIKHLTIEHFLEQLFEQGVEK